MSCKSQATGRRSQVILRQAQDICSKDTERSRSASHKSTFSRLRTLNKVEVQATKILLFTTCYLLLTTLTGCEAFARKFTRKPKEIKREEPIIEPQVYPEISVSREQLYKDYYLFWQTWSDELLIHLNENANAKKQKECAYEALDNVMKMQSVLSEQKAKAIEPLVDEFKTVKEIIFAGRLNGPEYEYLRLKVERIKSRIHRDFSFLKIRKDFL